MKLSVLSSAIVEYKLDTNYYHGKDIVHEGNLLHLDPNISWSKISKTTRHNIIKAQKLSDLLIKRVPGSKKNVQAFREIWFDPKDPSLPEQLDKSEIMYLAYLNKELVAGMILSPTKGTLYLHYMAGTRIAKEKNINSYIIWYALNDLKDSKYKFIDIGVSFRKSLYTFFKHWQTEKYPIIFEPPYILPQIRLAPFENQNIHTYSNAKTKIDQNLLKDYFSDDFTVLPRGIYAIKAILLSLNIKKNDNVAVFTTFNTKYISRCVSEPIQSLCKLSREINESTKAVIVIHEFGYPCKEIVEIKKQCKIFKIPLIEDCAWGIETRINAKHKVGEIGDYAVFSLPKILPMQYGAILKGLNISDEENWSKYLMLDYYKREIILSHLAEYLPKIADHNLKRRDNLLYLEKLFANDGYELFRKLESDEYPAAILVQLTNKKEMDEVAERYIKFGVEAGKYYPKNVIYLPIHQNLDKNQLDYIYAVFRGYLNLCKDYRRK